MEGLVKNVLAPAHLFGGVYEGCRVFITGHTGFKGSWLTAWLLQLGAHVTGYSLEPDTEPSLFAQMGLADQIDHTIGDVRDWEHLREVIGAAKPEIVFHLAAQPLVRRSYAEPRYTFDVNILGTANVLEATRECVDCLALVNVTTDKVYANDETGRPFSEEHPLGGHDPYSASKAASEIVTASYRESFFSAQGSAAVATARAGNVIGGGDWALDRLVPDCMRALSAGSAVVVRNPGSIRPWQHVLEPLSGYLHLATALSLDRSIAGPYNFGPDSEAARTVGEVADRSVLAWGAGSWHTPHNAEHVHEAVQLRLDISKANELLGWRPVWGFDETVERTVGWYRAYSVGESPTELVEADLNAYVNAARIAAAPWTLIGERP